jgi:hypothetical protein
MHRTNITICGCQDTHCLHCHSCFRIYRVIKKSLCTWWLQYRKLQVMFKVSRASLQTFIDTRLTLTPSVIPNSNYVIMVSDWNCLKYFCVFSVLQSSGAQRLFDHHVLLRFHCNSMLVVKPCCSSTRHGSVWNCEGIAVQVFTSSLDGVSD